MSSAPDNPLASFLAQTARLNPAAEGFAVNFIDALLAAARQAGASDLHLQPPDGGDGFAVLWRLNGVLHPVATFPKGKQNVVARLKVLADLLTYKTETPQEGRIRLGEHGVEMRLSTFPTIHGEKAVVRLFIAAEERRTLEQLGLPDDLLGELSELLDATSGILLVSGPAGSGKTTTLYACLRRLTDRSESARSITSLEDPVEAVIPGVAQSQVKASAGFTYANALKSLLRQDPEVIMVGEIRDRETADMVFQASLTGHLVLTSFHAGTSAEAISRLSDMDIAPYILRSGINAILTQRLLRRRCSCVPPGDPADPRCANCHGTGFNGRLLIAELARPQLSPLREAILSRSDAREIGRALVQSGMTPLRERAQLAVSAGLTTELEVHRVLGGEKQS